MSRVNQIIGGPTGCTGLSDEGRRQCELLRDRFLRTGEVRADVLLASTLPRAIETAEVIAPALGDLAIQTDCDLCELHPGESDAMSWSDHRRLHAFDWDLDPHQPFSPGGESLSGFQARAAAAIERVVADHAGQAVVIATHGGVIETTLMASLGLPLDRRLKTGLHVENTSISEWVHDDAGWRLVRYNDAAHLLSGALHA